MKAPRYLSKDAKSWWNSVNDEYALDQHHYKLLEMACSTWDRCTSARKVIDQFGATYVDRYGQPKSRPEVAIERDSRIAFARLVRELDLDFQGSSDRPPALLSNRRV
jgi:P27 family predicted phage terminase small subunit